jgi:hypothetical protein
MRNKVGVVTCSGEEIPEGMVSRVAARRVLEELKPNDTMTICVPLYLAGGGGGEKFCSQVAHDHD